MDTTNRRQFEVNDLCQLFLKKNGTIPFTQKRTPKSDTFCLLFIVSIFLQEFLTQIIDFKLSSVCCGAKRRSCSLCIYIQNVAPEQKCVTKFKTLLVTVISLNFPMPSHKNRPQNRIHFCVKLIPLTFSMPPFTQKPTPQIWYILSSVYCVHFSSRIVDTNHWFQIVFCLLCPFFLKNAKMSPILGSVFVWKEWQSSERSISHKVWIRRKNSNGSFSPNFLIHIFK